ncbi:MAG: class I SAM-dependent methyltransferase [Solirubrobacterales bacterium]|nr:class I SAM-dependent methyltransferase [Solirubrobacterales bacterium]
MTESDLAPSSAAVFDTFAEEYERHRPRYPEELIDRACAAAALRAGDRVLEIGCGTGQLTRSLVARGLSVTAIDPGEHLVALAGRAAQGPGRVEFINRRFEEAPLTGRFRAVFSASAFHWVDPNVAWRRAARALAPGGVLALIQYCGLREERTAADADMLMAALARTAPALAADFPPARGRDAILSGVEQRRENVSQAWHWVSGLAASRDHAADLFEGVEVATVPVVMEQTADELNALFRTTSVYHRLPAAQGEALERANREIEEQLGRPLRSSLLMVLVTARRVHDPV